MSESRPVSTLRTHLVHENEFVRVWHDDVVFSSGRAGSHVRVESVREGRGVVVLVRAGDRVALVRVYRYPTGRWEWALPRGFSEDEDSVATARREVREELGLDDITPVRLGTLTPDSGLMSTRVDVYRLVLAAVPDVRPRDTEEVHEVAWLTSDELEQRIVDGEIEDGFTLGAMSLDRLTP